MDSAPVAAPLASAVCPKHPERPAVATCERCGTFLCQGCLASVSPPLCEPCRARRGIGLMHEDFTFGGALAGSWSLLSPVLGSVLVVAAVLAVPIGLANHAMEVARVDSLMKICIDLLIPGTIGLLGLIAALALMTAHAKEQPGTLGWAVGEGFRAWPRVFGARFVAGLKIWLYGMLLVVPGIIKAVKLSMVTPVVYLEDPADSHERSESLVEGQGWEVFALLFIMQVIVIVALTIPTLGLNLLKTSMPPLAPVVHVVISFISQMGGIWSEAVVLAAYYGLRHQRAASE